MALKITDECIGCGTCLDCCPVDAIVESGEIYMINDDCTECKACVEACPVNAIVE